MAEIYLTRIDLPLAYDIHFGERINTKKIQAVYLTVDVRPKNQWVKPYQILMIIPSRYAGPDRGVHIAKNVLNLFLEDNDRYEVRTITEGDSYKVFENDACVICFDPAVDTRYFWIRPPRHEAN